MPLQLQWTDQKNLPVERIVRTRLRCYAKASGDFETFHRMLSEDRRVQPGDYLMATDDGEDIGTSTSYSMTMWARGRPLPCQGVAWVGTVKTRRRGGGAERGIASRLMHESICKGREREQVVSALMPFRSSFYEHFGYGIVERRAEWLVPLSIIPPTNFGGIRFYQAGDFEAADACRQRAVERGQCDIVTTPGAWELRHREYENGFEVVDSTETGAVRGWMYFTTETDGGKTIAKVGEHVADDLDAFQRQLGFLASLKDQYSFAKITLPIHLPLNRLLTEPQLPHRLVEHATCAMRNYTRMQIRILDHVRFLDGLQLMDGTKGAVTVSIRETEKSVSTIRLDFDGSRLTVKPAQGPADIECTDVTWASIASGDLPAHTAAALGLIPARSQGSIGLLDALSHGPAPFCGEYF